MSIKEQLLFDFDLTAPRILVNGDQGVIDNVKNIVQLSEEGIIVSCGKRYISIHGRNLSITFLEGEKMWVRGSIDSVEFHGKGEFHG